MNVQSLAPATPHPLMGLSLSADRLNRFAFFPLPQSDNVMRLMLEFISVCLTLLESTDYISLFPVFT